MTFPHTVLRYLTLVILLFVIGFFGYVLFIDFSQFRQERSQDISFVSDFTVQVAKASNSESLSPPKFSTIFDYRDWTKEQLNPDDVLLRVAGDLAPVRVADLQLRKKGVGYAFSGIQNIFEDDDISLVNLETPLVDDCPERSEGMQFCALPAFAGAMRDAGIEVVGLANNHSGNYGEKGLQETRRHLDESELLYFEDYESTIVRIKDLRVGLLAVNGVVQRGIDRDRLAQRITTLHDQVDVVVVSVHWGAEYVLKPTKAAGVAPDDPQEIAHWLVDSGVDLVVGHHPHVVQGVEMYKDGFISYSHGNLIFDQEWSKETKEGVIGNYVFRNNVLVDVYFSPVIIEDWVRPRFANQEEARTILNRMRQSSDLLVDTAK